MVKSRLSDEVPASSGEGRMKVGDVRTINVKDKDGMIVKTMTLTRTHRPYVDDLCDAYNAARAQNVIDMGGEWYVNHRGELKLGESQAFSLARTKNLKDRAERNRQDWKDRNGFGDDDETLI